MLIHNAIVSSIFHSENFILTVKKKVHVNGIISTVWLSLHRTLPSFFQWCCPFHSIPHNQCLREGGPVVLYCSIIRPDGTWYICYYIPTSLSFWISPVCIMLEMFWYFNFTECWQPLSPDFSRQSKQIRSGFNISNSESLRSMPNQQIWPHPIMHFVLFQNTSSELILTHILQAAIIYISKIWRLCSSSSPFSLYYSLAIIMVTVSRSY